MSVGDLDPLLESLSYLCNYHHVATTKESLCYGMPLKDGRMDIGLLHNAAKRAGLNCDIETGVKLESLSGISNPVIIFMDDNSAAGVLLSIDRKFAKIYFPGQDILGVNLPLTEIKKSYNGTVAYLRPQLVLSGYKNAWDFVKKKKESLKVPILSGIHWYAIFCLFTGFVLSSLILFIPYLLYSGHKIAQVLENGVVEQKTAVLFLASTLFLMWILVKEIWRRYDLVVKTKLEAKIHEQTFVLSQPILNSTEVRHNDYFFSQQLAKEIVSAESIQFSFRFCFCMLGLTVLSVYQPTYGVALQLFLLMVFLITVVYFNQARPNSEKSINTNRVRDEVIYNAFKHRNVIKHYGAWEAHYKNIFDFIRLKSVNDINRFYDSGVITVFILRLAGVVSLELCVTYWINDFSVSSEHLFTSVIFLLVVFFASSIISCISKFKKIDVMIERLNKASSYSTIADSDAKLITSVDFSKALEINVNESEFSINKSNKKQIKLKLKPGERVGLVCKNYQDKDALIDVLVGKRLTEVGYVKYGGEFIEHIANVTIMKEVTAVGLGELISGASVFENVVLGIKSATKKKVVNAVNQLGFSYLVDWHRKGIDRPIRGIDESGYFEDRFLIQITRGLLNESSVWVFVGSACPIGFLDSIDNSDYFKNKIILILLSKNESYKISFTKLIDLSNDEEALPVTLENV